MCDDWEAYLGWITRCDEDEEEEPETPYDAFEPDPDEGETTDEDTEMLGYCAVFI